MGRGTEIRDDRRHRGWGGWSFSSVNNGESLKDFTKEDNLI